MMSLRVAEKRLINIAMTLTRTRTQMNVRVVSILFIAAQFFSKIDGGHEHFNVLKRE